jgi:hypothetical protein
MVCGSGTVAKPADTKGRDPSVCCTDVDGCAAPRPACGVGGDCVDVPAPSEGYACFCASGYSGDFTINRPAVCSENGCDSNPQIDNINGASECAGTESGATCEFKCSPGYLPSAAATCTRGQWDSQMCNQRYVWREESAFSTCQETCGTLSTTTTQTVSCIGMSDGLNASNPGLCTRPYPLGDFFSKPLESQTCEAIGVNHTCDDLDDATMRDKCNATLVCTGEKNLISDISIPVKYPVYAGYSQANKQTFDKDILAGICQTYSAAGMSSDPSSSSLIKISDGSGSIIFDYGTSVPAAQVNPDTITSAIDALSSAGSALAGVNLPARRRLEAALDTSRRRLGTGIGTPTAVSQASP